MPMVIALPGVVLFLGLMLVLLYNSLVRARNLARNAWAQIDVQLKRRSDLIPNLVESVKGYAAHERQVFENVTRARAAAAAARTLEERHQAENMLTGALRTLFAVAEGYPRLQASQNFLQLQRELSDTESKIAFARQFYNDTAMKYNNRIQTFPSNLLAGALGFVFIPYFGTEDVRDRAPVRVGF
ncbi:MAG: LemA family protein [Firmicutes bacterium]|nr:LemA family protein [Bacillota bacterium]